MLKLLIGLVLGIIMGYVAQRSRYCIQGSFRDLLIFRETHLFKGVVTTIGAFALVWLITGYHHSP